MIASAWEGCEVGVDEPIPFRVVDPEPADLDFGLLVSAIRAATRWMEEASCDVVGVAMAWREAGKDRAGYVEILERAVDRYVRTRDRVNRLRARQAGGL